MIHAGGDTWGQVQLWQKSAAEEEASPAAALQKLDIPAARAASGGLQPGMTIPTLLLS